MIINTVIKLFTGMPGVINHKGGLLRTSLFNRKEQHSISVTFKGIVGNELADVDMHGGTERIAYVYSNEHYEYWRKKRKKITFYHGIFGENLLTEEAIPENELYIGDRFKIGSAYFSVSGPRLPCTKLGIKMGDMSLIDEFLLSGKTGFYLRLDKEGIIEINDRIEKVSTGTNKLSVFDVSQLFVRPNPETLDQVQKSKDLAKDLRNHIIHKYEMVQ